MLLGDELCVGNVPSLPDDGDGTTTTLVVVAVRTGCGVVVTDSLSHGSSSYDGKLGDGVDESVLCAMAEISIHVSMNNQHLIERRPTHYSEPTDKSAHPTPPPQVPQPKPISSC